MNEPDLQLLIQRAKVLGLIHDPEISPSNRALLAAADRTKRPLTWIEANLVCLNSGIDPMLIQRLQQKAESLVTAARCHLLKRQPELVLEGGSLFPPERAEACWRDCWDFLRLVIYAVACNQSCFTDIDGMAALRELYRRMEVPTEGLNIALRQLQLLALEEVSQSSDHQLIDACFQHLRDQLNKTAVKS